MQFVARRELTRKGGMRTAERIFSVVVAFLPLLCQYRGIGSILSFGEVLLIPFILYFMIGMIRKGKVKYNEALLLFYVFVIVTTIFNSAFEYFIFADTITLFLRLVFYGITVWVARDHFDYEYVKNIYVIGIFVASVYLIIQYIFHYTVGGYLPMYLNYNLLFPPEMGIRGKTLAQQFQYYYRASSVFLEPSYYSFFVLPALCILLFQRKKSKIEIATFISICIALVLSTASSGLIGLALLLLLFLFKRTKGTSSLVKIGLVLGIVVLVAYYFITVESASDFAKMLSYGASFNYRVGRGWLIYKDLPIFHKLFGVGLNNLEPYMHYYNISTPYDESNLNYICTLLGIPVYFGIVGTIPFIIYLLSLKKKALSASAMAYFWLVVFIMSYETIMFTHKFAFIIIIYEAFARSTAKDDIAEKSSKYSSEVGQAGYSIGGGIR